VGVGGGSDLSEEELPELTILKRASLVSDCKLTNFTNKI